MGRIVLDKADGIATLTVDNVEVKNGLTPQMGHDLAAVCGAAVGAGINLMLATDLRVVAQNARILAGFLRIGLHPGGGFFTIAGRTGGREATAAIGLFSEEI